MAVFVCPNCAFTQDAPDEYVGRTAKCAKCETRGEITKSKPKPQLSSPPVQAIPPENHPKPINEQPKVNVGESHSPSTVLRNEVRIMIGLLAALLVAQLFGLTSTKSSTTKWEYKIESPSDATFEMALERLGNEGWELVFARRATSEYKSASYEMIFRRPKR